ncbi:MAG: hypothetical protein ACE37H_08230 [Phycisphaeraceae bacterium]
MLEILCEILRRAAQDLDDAQARYALIGGLAIGARTVLRFTQDADLTVAVQSDQDAERIAGSLFASGYRLQTELDHQPSGRLAVLRLISPACPPEREVEDLPLLDLLFHSIGIEHETVAQADPIQIIAGVTLPTARLPHLIAMKVLSESDRRPMDRIDLQNLVAVATPDDLAEVPPLLDKITERGFADGKDLHAVFRAFVAQMRQA